MKHMQYLWLLPVICGHPRLASLMHSRTQIWKVLSGAVIEGLAGSCPQGNGQRMGGFLPDLFNLFGEADPNVAKCCSQGRQVDWVCLQSFTNLRRCFLVCGGGHRGAGGGGGERGYIGCQALCKTDFRSGGSWGRKTGRWGAAG